MTGIQIPARPSKAATPNNLQRRRDAHAELDRLLDDATAGGGFYGKVAVEVVFERDAAQLVMGYVLPAKR